MTEKNESFNVTGEHPIWLQGKGWTQAKDIKRADPIATQTGDILVLQNTRINQPLKVYNFSVANTPNYFVGTQGIWVHNAGNECDIYGGAAGNNAVIIGGQTCVYSCVVNGTTRYVGITVDINRRGREHLRAKGIEIEQIDGLDNLSRADARAVEQTLIHFYGLGRNGGTLLNKINSISLTKNPTAYEQSLIRGRDILRSVNYTGFD